MAVKTVRKDGLLECAGTEPLHYHLYGPDTEARLPGIVYLHGFKGFKDWGWGAYAGEYFAARGFRLLAFNFSHNGIGADLEQFTEKDRFRENTFSREYAETLAVVRAWAAGDAGLPPVTCLGLLGHSRGGGIALLTAPQLPEAGAVCTWAAVSTFFRYPPEVIAGWKARGVIETKNTRTGEVLELGWNLHQDLMDNGYLNIEAAVRRGTQPLCLLHGTADEAVPLADWEQLQAWARHRTTQAVAIPGTGHTFDIRHPWAGSSPAFETVLESTASFFSETLITTSL